MDAADQSPTELTPETTDGAPGRAQMDAWMEEHSLPAKPTHRRLNAMPISWDKPEQITTLIKIMAGGYATKPYSEEEIAEKNTAFMAEKLDEWFEGDAEGEWDDAAQQKAQDKFAVSLEQDADGLDRVFMPVREYLTKEASKDEIEKLAYALNTSRQNMSFAQIGVQNLNDLLNLIGNDGGWNDLRIKLDGVMTEGDIVDYLTSGGAISEWISLRVVPRPGDSSGKLVKNERGKDTWVVDQCTISENFGMSAWVALVGVYNDFYMAKNRTYQLRDRQVRLDEVQPPPSGAAVRQADENQRYYELYRMVKIMEMIQEKISATASKQGLVQPEKPSSGVKLKKLKKSMGITADSQTIFREAVPWIFNLHKDWSPDLQKEREREWDTLRAEETLEDEGGNMAQLMGWPWMKVTRADGIVFYSNRGEKTKQFPRPPALGEVVLSEEEISSLKYNIDALYDSREDVVSGLCQKKRHVPVIDLETTKYLGEQFGWRPPRGALSECLKVRRSQMPAEWAPFALAGEDLDGWQTEADKSPTAPHHNGGGKRKSNRKKRKSNRKKRKSNRKKRKSNTKKRKYTKKKR